MKRYICFAVLLALGVFMVSAGSPCVVPLIDESHTAFAYDDCSDLAKWTFYFDSNRTVGPFSASGPAWMDLVGISGAIAAGSLEIALYSRTDFPNNVQAFGNGTTLISIVLDLDGDSQPFISRDGAGHCFWYQHGYDRVLRIVSNFDVSLGVSRVGMVRSFFCSDDIERHVRSVKGVTYESAGSKYVINIPIGLLGEIGESMNRPGYSGGWFT